MPHKFKVRARAGTSLAFCPPSIASTVWSPLLHKLPDIHSSAHSLASIRNDIAAAYNCDRPLRNHGPFSGDTVGPPDSLVRGQGSARKTAKRSMTWFTVTSGKRLRSSTHTSANRPVLANYNPCGNTHQTNLYSVLTTKTGSVCLRCALATLKPKNFAFLYNVPSEPAMRYSNGAPNNSLDWSGRSVFRIKPGAAKLREIAPPGQL